MPPNSSQSGGDDDLGTSAQQYLTNSLQGFTFQRADTIVTALCFACLLWIRVLRRHPKYPPGPKPLPIIGNALEVPKHHQWLTFAEWGVKYGPLVHAEAIGTHFAVINSSKIASDLLEKRSKLYSDRPTFIMAGECVGIGDVSSLSKSNDKWAEQRRLMARFMGSRSKIHNFEDLLRAQASALVEMIRLRPENWALHIGNYAGKIILLMTYGYEPSGEHDRLVKVIQETMEIFNETTTVGAYAVDVFPFLRYIPSWVPGTGWQKTAEGYRARSLRALTEAYEWTKSNIATGLARSSFMVDQLQSDEPLTKEREDVLQWTALGMYGGGADTTVCGFKWFLQTLARHPAEQKRAQDELDLVLGKGILPISADRSRLPYVEAIYLENLRMFPILPVAIPHVNKEDDLYEGYFIPKGTVVIPNVWQFNRDPETYIDPMTFNPSRFLGPNAQRNPKDFVFGFGRRVCPGMHLGDESMWLACASLLAAFNVQAPLDANGGPILPPIKDNGEIINHPDPIECTISPRF